MWSFPSLDWPPYMALGFKNPDPGQSIFKGWLDKLGRVDQEEMLKVTIITGIDKAHPSSYKVLIGTNANIVDSDPSSSHAVLVSRWLRVDPPDLRNLDMFRRRYDEFGRYIIVPGHYSEPEAESKPFFELGIVKSEVRFREAWEIGENGTDSVALTEEDDPIIPEDITDAPVLAVMAKSKKPQRGKKEVPREIVELIQAKVPELASDREAIERLFGYLKKSQIKGHWPCYCGSGEKLRRCHLTELMNLRSDSDVATVIGGRPTNS